MAKKNKVLKSAGFRIKSGMTECAHEQGRSMVEMLGVLAVIGVLSVAGIAAYSTAMNRYRANELLNEASKRATIVAMQIASGKTGEGLSINEFTQPSGYLFGVDSTYASGGKTFKLTLTKYPSGNIDGAVCDQMKATAGDNGIMQINTDCSEITFNSDLSKGGESEEEEEEGEPLPCTSNSNCPNKKYCDVEVTSLWENYENDCAAGSGICKPIGTVKNAGNYVQSTKYMNRYSAENWCAALNRSIPSESEVKAIVDSATYDGEGNETSGVLSTAFGEDTDGCFWLDTYYSEDICVASNICFSMPFYASGQGHVYYSTNHYALCK